MSRRRIPATDPVRHPEVFVGWDPPMETYFAQVFGPPDAEGDAPMAFWAGGKHGEVQTLAALRAALAPYAPLDDATALRLAADRVVNDGLPQGQMEANRLAEARLADAGGDVARALAALEAEPPRPRAAPSPGLAALQAILAGAAR